GQRRRPAAGAAGAARPAAAAALRLPLLLVLVAEALEARLAGDADDQRVEVALGEALRELEYRVRSLHVDVDEAAPGVDAIRPGAALTERRRQLDLTHQQHRHVLAQHGHVADALAAGRPHLLQ